MFIGTAALFSLALALGGLGPHAPLFSGLLDAAAYPLLVAVLLFGRIGSIARPDCVIVVLFLLLLVALGASQLVPIPASTWRTLPNRDVPIMVLETLGQADRWRPLSLAPEDTRLVVQSWLPPIAIFVATLVASRYERGRLAWLVVVAAAISSALGLLQLSFGDGTLFPYPEPPFTRYPGLFANYNHQAIFLAAAVALLPTQSGGEPAGWSAQRWWLAAVWILALVGVLITTSRAGLALFGLSSLITAARLAGSSAGRRDWTKRRFGGDRRRAVAIVSVLAALLAIVGWIAADGYRAELMAARFGDVGTDARLEFWRTSLAAARDYFPYGAGFGTFETAYQMAEPLEQVRNYLVNHAHNDYLELALEAGAGGVLLVVLFLAWFGTRLVHLAMSRGGRDPLAWSGATIVMLVMLHSLVDYPLRTEAIGCLFAFACASLIAPPSERTSRVRLRAPARTLGAVA